MDYSSPFPRIDTRPDIDRLFNACKDIDGSELVAAVLRLKIESGKSIRAALQTVEIRGWWFATMQTRQFQRPIRSRCRR